MNPQTQSELIEALNTALEWLRDDTVGAVEARAIVLTALARVQADRERVAALMSQRVAICDEMWEKGGSFAASLGNALLHADSENARRILSTFPEIIAEYAAMASKTTNQDS